MILNSIFPAHAYRRKLEKNRKQKKIKLKSSKFHHTEIETLCKILIYLLSDFCSAMYSQDWNNPLYINSSVSDVFPHLYYEPLIPKNSF